MTQEWIVGIDEVGRGSLAGPVVVAAALLPKGRSFTHRTLGRLKDSKKLSARQREAWLSHFLRAPWFGFAIARIYPRVIEKRNISNAANVAALRAFAKLEKTRALGPKTKVFLDGGLFLGSRRRLRNVRTIVKGDEKINAVKAASIVAKVYRDRLMLRQAKKYPAYAFEKHKGYATRAHRAALALHGPSPIHRLTFLKNFSMMNGYGRSTH